MYDKYTKSMQDKKNLHGGKYNKMLFMVFNLVTVFTEKVKHEIIT